MRTYLRILSYAYPVGRLAPQYLLFSLLHTVFSIVNIAVMIPLLRVLFVVEQVSSTEKPQFAYSIDYLEALFHHYFHWFIVQHGQVGGLYFICIAVVVSTVLSNAFKYMANVVLALLRNNVVANLRSSFFNTIMSFDLRYFTENKKGDIISRGTADVLEVENAVASSFAVIIKEPLMMIGLFFVLFRMNAELTLITLVLLPVSGLLISQLVKKLKSSAEHMQETMGQMSNALEESLGGMRVVKAFAVESYFKKKFQHTVKQYTKHNFRIATIYNMAPSTSEILGAVTLSVLLLIGGHQIFGRENAMAPEVFIGFIVLFSQILAPAKALAKGIGSINRGIASGERIFKVLDQPVAVQSQKDGVIVTDLKEGITFQDVSFAYDEKAVLTHIDLSIPKGKVVALVGPSGGGKSTLADLVPRFYDPQVGRILIDGTDLQQVDIHSLRKLIGFVTQETILFNDTVYNNIAFGLPDVSLEDVMAAAKVANAHTFIQELELGYDTLVGERGTKLSGGQRQRLSIARAVLKNPPVLVLDEATSALDSESEKLVQESLHRLMQNRTTLVIAHRLSTIQNADEIIVIKEGRIEQRGTHEQLLKQNGTYRQLIEVQTI